MSDRQPMHAPTPVHAHESDVKRLDRTREDLEGLASSRSKPLQVLPTPSKSAYVYMQACLRARVEPNATKATKPEEVDGR